MPNPEECPYVAWVDLETTGSKDTDNIIEVGFVITTRDLEEVQQHSFVVKPSEFWEYQMNDFVRQMHTDNGLIRNVNYSGLPTRTVDDELARIMQELYGTDHVPLAGSGVSHFDRRYIQAELPRFDKHLAYWCYDVGVLRRSLRLLGHAIPGIEATKATTHRALDDILSHIEEMRLIRAYLKTWNLEEVRTT